MTNNQPRTLVALEDVVRYFDEFERHSKIKGYFHHAALRKCIEKLPPAKDSLSEELEGLKGEAVILAHNEYFWTASCDTGKNTVRIEADGDTPLAAVIALKEALNSKP